MTYYNLISNQFTGLNAIVVPGTLRDSLFLLAVVLEQQTELQPTEIMTDTGAYTDVVFGLFWLLGHRFSPRIADIGGARYWRIDSTADYGVLNGIARHRINTRLFAENWDDMLRLAGSLKLGKVQALNVMRTLQIGNRPTKLAQAVAEAGRIDKTIHCLTYIDDESKRRRTLVQLNRGEDRHKLARAISTGNGGSCGSATARGKRISWERWAWPSTSSSFGTPSTSMPLFSSLRPKAIQSNRKTLHVYRLWFSTTSIYSAAMPSRCLIQSFAASCVLCVSLKMFWRMWREPTAILGTLI